MKCNIIFVSNWGGGKLHRGERIVEGNDDDDAEDNGEGRNSKWK